MITFSDFEKKLNLDDINFLISSKEEGPKWPLKKTKIVEKLYKEFLYLYLLNPNRVIVPTKEVDEYWHNHIMDTQKYINDCNLVFGSILHHYPYLGTKGEEDKKLLQKLFDETNDLYVSIFGHSPVIVDSAYSACGGGGGNCGSGRHINMHSSCL